MLHTNGKGYSNEINAIRGFRQFSNVGTIDRSMLSCSYNGNIVFRVLEYSLAPDTRT